MNLLRYTILVVKHTFSFPDLHGADSTPYGTNTVSYVLLVDLTSALRRLPPPHTISISIFNGLLSGVCQTKSTRDEAQTLLIVGLLAEKHQEEGDWLPVVEGERR
jgi:hypothetical protein